MAMTRRAPAALTILALVSLGAATDADFTTNTPPFTLSGLRRTG